MSVIGSEISVEPDWTISTSKKSGLTHWTILWTNLTAYCILKTKKEY